uniref:DUF3615 domain-containing protein n=1 Tax=Oryza punctata TaxID=4537 RepID=A0A0E0L7H1_ORYPU
MLCQQPVPIHRRRRRARRRWPLAVRRLPESSSTTPGALDLLRYERNFRRASPPPRPTLVNSAEPSSAQALRKPDVSFSVGLLSNTASKEPITAHTSSSSSPQQTVQPDDTDTSTPSQCCLWSSPGSSILVRRPRGWYFVFYIRMDPGGCFHMYPDVGCGPYQSLSEVDDAINQHLHDLRIPEMGEELDRLPPMEKMIRQTMYWPDGKRKRCKSAGYSENDKCHLIQALVEKYNDDHNLLEDFAYELKDFLQHGVIYEDQRRYHHLNFTAKHPNNDAYSGGHLDGYLPFGVNSYARNNDEELSVKNEEDMLRRMYKSLDKPGGFKRPIPKFASRINPMLCQQPVPIHRRRRRARRRWPLAVRRLPESSSTTPGALDLLRYGRNFRRASPPPRPPLVNSAEPSSAEALRKPDVSFSGMLLSSTASEEPIDAHTSSSPHTVQRDDTDTLIPSQCCLRSSPGSSILVRRPPGWYFVFYIRMDPGGCFHMYPDVGCGPYQRARSLIGSLSIERMIRQDMYWPDGKRKHFNLAGGYEKDKRCLIQALVEKYNDDHNLLGDFAYELKEFLQIGEMYEDQRYYYHINFTTKTKGAHKSGCAMDNLFFAELSHMQGKDEWVVSCCCVIKPTANGHCYGCRNDGKSSLKHPNNSDAYSGGHLDGCLPFGLNDSRSKYDGLNPEDEEAMLRSMYKGMDEPGYLEGLFA